MEKRNEVKKLLSRTLIGFPIAVMLLLLAYVGIYFIANEEVFNYELNQLHDIKTLISQIIYSGMCGLYVFIFLYMFSYLQNSTKFHSYILKHPYKTTILFILLLLIFVSTLTILISFGQNILSKNILSLTWCSLIILVFAIFIIYFIYALIEDATLKKLIKKFQEK